jgi:MFS transporter, PPP family, 3-phenylpropionic acid transporter
MLVAGWIAVRIGLRGLFAIGALLYGVSFLSWAVVDSVGLIIASRVLIGFSFASVVIATVLTISTLLPAELQATGQALFQTTAFGIAAIIANVVGGLLYSTAGHAAVFGLGAVLAVAAAIGGWLVMPRRPVAHPTPAVRQS